MSLACALIHHPPLLILDEPTVGTDPILRQTIWFHLVSLCKSGLTIILTTHYIEEARTANVVAFMRNGKILAENEPNFLLDKYNSTNLEEVFLKLCHLESKDSDNTNKTSIVIEIKDKIQSSCYENEIIKDIKTENEEEKDGKCLISTPNITHIQSNETISDKTIDDKTDQSLVINSISTAEDNKADNSCVYIEIRDETNGDSNKSSSKLLAETTISVKTPRFSGKCSALLHKNFKRLSRNWGQLIFFIILPAIQMALLLLSISDGPTDLNLAICDEEIINNATNGWGKLFIQSINNKTFNLNYYNSMEKALKSVELGHNYAAIFINDRFSKALRLRHLYGSDVDEETVEESQIIAHIDWSNQAIGVQIERFLYEAMMKFAEEVAIRSNTNPESIKIPLTFETPVYGNRDESMRDFVLPGCYVLISFFSTGAVTSHLILEERRDGLLERSLVAGITAFEFLLSHTLTQFLILCLQIIIMLLMPFVVFDRQITGSLTLLIALALSQGFCGISFGLMISAICSDIVYAAMFTICLFFISIILGGVFWPIENMPSYLRYCSNLMPSTLPIQSMRSILYRKWSLNYFEVYIGFTVTYVWFAFFVIIALIFLRRSF